MSATIDERVVEMKFNNKDFEQNAKTTINTIDRLKEALNFQSSARGLENVQNAVRNVDMSGLENGVESVRVKFSALQLTAITVFQDMVRKAEAAGLQIARSFTLDPIIQGFNEYEQKIGSVQTILANTKYQTAKASTDSINEVNAAAEQAVAKSEELNNQAISNLQKRQSQEVKALQKSNQAQMKALQKGQKEQQKALDKKHKEELEKVQESEQKKQEALQKSQEKQLKTLTSIYDKRYEALEKTEEKEQELVVKNHEARLKMYKEEYMEKLKVADENRYNQIKAIDDEIESLRNLSKAEDEERENAEKQAKLSELKNKVSRSETDDERKYFAKQLADYEAELEAERVKKERENRIEELQNRKDDIKEEYSDIKEQIQQEYTTKTESESDLYKTELKNLQEQQKTRREQIQKNYNKEMNLLQKKLNKESEALNKRQKDELEKLQERQQNESEALQERQDAEREALQDRQSAAQEALSERQTAEMEALNERHEAELANIEEEKNDKIAALNAAAAKEQKPTTLKDVNEALDELNDYADKTIYNFSEMTRNIGTFTAAGVDLDTSVSAIKGISNLAAMSGAGAGKAANAMYQLSQAIASGTVRLTDWMSVEHSDMGGKLFQESLMETARVHGVAIDEMLAKNGSFRETLQEGWLSSDILLETLRKFTGDISEEELKALGYTDEQIQKIIQMGQDATEAATKVRTWSQLVDTTKESLGSGWAQTFEMIIGDFDEATELWTGVFNAIDSVISKSADARNQLIQGWKDQGGRDALIQAFGNVWEGLSRLVTQVSKAFRDIFPATTSETLVKFTKRFEEITTGFRNAYPIFFKIRKVFSGLFSIVDIGIEAFKAFFKAISPVTDVIKDIALALLDAGAWLGDLLTSIDKTVKETGFLSTLGDIFNTIASSEYEIFKTLINTVSSIPNFGFLETLKDFLLDGVEALGKWVGGLSDTITQSGVFETALETLKDGAGTASQMISSAFETIKNAVGGAFDNLSKFITSAKDFFKSGFKNIPNVVKAMGVDEESEGGSDNAGPFSWIAKSIKRLATTAVNNIKAIPSNISGTIEKIKNIFSTLVDSISGSIKNGAGKITDFFTAIKDGISTAFNAIKNVGSKFKTAIDSIRSAMETFLYGASQLFSYENMSKAIGLTQKGALAALGFSVSGFLKNLSKNMKNMTEAFKGIGTFGDVFKNVLDPIKGPIKEVCDVIKDSVTSTFGAIQKEINSKALMNIAKAIVLIAAALAVLAFIPVDKLKAAAIVMASLFADLSISMAILSKSLKTDEKETNSIKSITTVMIGMSAAILILATALKKISGADIPNMAAATAAIIVLMKTMSNVMYEFEESGKEATQYKKSATAMIGLATAVLILSKAVEILGGLDPGTLIMGTAVVTGFIAALGYFEKSTKDSNFSASSGVGLIAMAGSLLVLQKAVEKFGTMNVDTLTQGLVSVLALIAALAAFETLAGKAEHALSASVGTMVIATAMLMLVKPLKQLGEMDIFTLLQGLGGVGIALAEFAVALRLMEGTEKSALGILGVSAALLVLTPVLKTLGKMKSKSIAKALIALAGALTIIGAAAIILNPYTSTLKELAKGIALMGIAVAAAGAGVLAFSAGLLLLAGAGAVGAKAIVSVVKTIIIGALDTINEALPKIVDIIKNLIVAIIQGMLDIVGDVAKGIFDLIIKTLDEMTKFVGQIVEAVVNFIIVVLQAIGEHLPELVQVAVELFVKFFASIIESLKGLDTETLENALLGIGLFAVLMTTMAGFSLIAGPAIAGIAEAAVVIAELTALLVAAGAIASIPGLTWLIGKGGGLLQAVGTAIGQFIGGIVGGLLEGVSSTLPTVGENLSSFMEKVKPFIDGLDGIDENKLNAVTNLATIAQTMADCETFITSGQLGVTLNSFADQLITFGPKVKEFSDSISGIDEGAVTAAANAAKIMNEVATNLPKTGGFWQTLVGTPKTLEDFGTELKAFGPSIKAFSDSVSGGIDKEAITVAADAAKIMNEVVTNLPKTGGFWQTFFGETKSLSDYGTELESFGPSIKAFSDSVSGGIDSTAVEAATNAALALAGLANNLPESGGFLQDFFGEQNLETFGQDLESFGASLKAYSDTITADGGIKYLAVTASANAAKALMELDDSLPDGKGFFAFFTGEQDLSDFGEKLKTFGEGFKGYYDSISSINTTTLSSVITSIQNMVQIAKDTKDLSTTGLKNFGKNLKKMGDNGLSDLIGVFENSEQKIIDAVNIMVGYITAQIELDKDTVHDKAKELAKKVINGIKKGYENNQETLTDATTALATSINTSLTTKIKEESFKTFGKTILKGLKSGMSDSVKLEELTKSAETVSNKVYNTIKNKLTNDNFKSMVKNAISGLCTGMKDTYDAVGKYATALVGYITGPMSAISYTNFYTVGHNIGVGLANGMNDTRKDVNTAATNLAKGATKSTTNTLQVKSPSRVFEKIGKYVGEGLANGIIESTGKVSKSAEDLADTAVNPVQLAIDKIETISSDFDLSPTITPVLDLSNVEGGAQAISNALGGSIDLGTTNSFAQSAYAMQQSQQTMLLSEQNNRIAKLVESVNQLTSNVKSAIASTQPNNTFNVQNDDPRAAAQEINLLLQRQAERRKAVWG